MSLLTFKYEKRAEIFSSPIQVPVDPTDKRYTISFSVNQEDEAKKFFNEYGFVVIRDILSHDECQQTLSEIFDILEKETKNKFNRNDMSTWNHWPENLIERYGSVSKPPIFTPQFMMNHQNLKIYKICSH